MKVELEIEANNYTWEDNSYVKIEQPSKFLMEIQANREGLISLAKQLLSVAYSTDKNFYIHHWAELRGQSDKDYCYGDLEEGSLQLSIVRVDKKGR